MNPGRELDALVAEDVMGWRPTVRRYSDGTDHSGWYANGNLVAPLSWSPSTDIAAAWQVVEKLEQQSIRLEVIPIHDELARWYVHLLKWDDQAELTCWTDLVGPCASATIPHAVCIAALKAVGAI